MATLYTKQNIDDALIRAQIALYIISKTIEDEYLYLYNFRLRKYKELQYDIYILFRVLSSEQQFVSYNPVSSLWELAYYDLVSKLIKLTKQIDTAGLFGSYINPYFQSSTNVTVVNDSGSSTNSSVIGDLTAFQLATQSKVYSLNQLIIESDTGFGKKGNGVSRYNDLPYLFGFTTGSGLIFNTNTRELSLDIDTEVTENSRKLITSGDVYKSIQSVLSQITDTFPECIVFTYDGTNNVQQLSFEPSGVVLAFLNTRLLNPTLDYYFEGESMVIDKIILETGTEYLLNIVYKK